MTQHGKYYIKMSLATSETWKDQNGQKQERTEWHHLVYWPHGQGGVAQFLVKGKLIYVKGRIQSREYEHNGERKKAYEILVSDLKLIGDSHGPRREDREPYQQPAQQPAQQTAQRAHQQGYTEQRKQPQQPRQQPRQVGQSRGYQHDPRDASNVQGYSETGTSEDYRGPTADDNIPF
jgi:single-strand DNA-binding protein